MAQCKALEAEVQRLKENRETLIYEKYRADAQFYETKDELERRHKHGVENLRTLSHSLSLCWLR